MSSVFIGVYIALYDYEAQNEEELSIKENDLLYLLETSETDDWWKVKKRVLDADVEEPVGLVPKTYIEPAPVVASAVSLYDYDKQTEEELTFTEGTKFDVYDLSDPNWTLGGIDNKEFGFVPANYIEISSGSSAAVGGATPTAANAPLPSIPTTATSNSQAYGSVSATNNFPLPPQRSDRLSATPELEAPAPKVATRTANIDSPTNDSYEDSRNGNNRNTNNNNYDYGDDDDVEAPPPMPSRPRGNTASSSRSNRNNRSPSKNDDNSNSDELFSWNVHEIDGRRKRKARLAIGQTSIFVTSDGAATSEEWSIRDLINYSNERKHVFLEFKNPTASFEFHAGSKDSADAIMSILGDLKGMNSVNALKDVKEAAIPTNGKKRGKVLYDFEAASPDELTVNESDTVVILNDKKSKEWWMVQNANTGKTGVVPSNYIKITSQGKNNNEGSSSTSATGRFRSLFSRKSSSNLKEAANDDDSNDYGLSPKKNKNRNRSNSNRNSNNDAELQKEQQALEREREELERQRRRQSRKERELRDREERERVRRADERERERRSGRVKEQKTGGASSTSASKDGSKPNTHRVRTWIDRSGSFKVEAEFLGCSDGKVHLHKVNGVKIAVAAQKLSVEDLEYVERITGMSLESYKYSAKKSSSNAQEAPKREEKQREKELSRPSSASNNKGPVFNEKLYDYWFNVFVESGVDANVCDRYARNFANEQMDESVLEDITPSLMRTLGLREGDILRVSKHIDAKFGKNTAATIPASNGLFSSADGSLKNNTDGSAAKFEDDAWAIKSAAKTVESSSVISPPTGSSIQDLVNIKPVEASGASQAAAPAAIKPVTATKTGSGIPAMIPQKTANTGALSAEKTGGLVPMQTGALMAMPTGFMPITMVPMRTGGTIGLQQTGGFISLQPTGVTLQKTGGFVPMPATSFGGNGLNPALTGGIMALQKTGGLAPMPTTSFGNLNSNITGSFVPLQKTGGFAPMPNTSFGNLNSNFTGGIVPLQKTGGFAPMPNTSFGGLNQNGLVQLQPTGVTLQKTGNGMIMPTNTSTILPLQKTGTFPTIQPTITGLPQNSFGNSALTGGIGGGMPQTSFGNPSFGNPSFGNPALTGGIGGGLPQTSFGNPGYVNPALTGGFVQQQQQQQPMGMNGLTNMLQNTSIGNPNMGGMNNMVTGFNTGMMPQQTTFGAGFPQQQQQQQTQQPMTSFGNNTQTFAPLQSQPTGAGFGNQPITSFGQQPQGGLMSQQTGRRANIAAATPDNPFGF